MASLEKSSPGESSVPISRKVNLLLGTGLSGGDLVAQWDVSIDPAIGPQSMTVRFPAGMLRRGVAREVVRAISLHLVSMAFNGQVPIDDGVVENRPPDCSPDA